MNNLDLLRAVATRLLAMSMATVSATTATTSPLIHGESMKLTPYKNVPVLVTGGCGFIGSHVAEALVAQGAQVTILDDCSTGFIRNISHIHENITFIRGSVTELQTCLQAVRGKKIVFHLAAYISVPGSMSDPTLCQNTNVIGTMNMLEACRQEGVERFILSSSAAVYGPQEEVCVETMQCAPTSPYGYSKWIGELLCQQYARCFGLKSICLRYFNVHGPRQNPAGAYAGAVAKFTFNMQHDLPITIFGDGTQTRDFIGVKHVAQANLQLALLDAELMTGQPYNIATGHSISLLELIAQLKQEFPDYNKTITFAPARPGDIAHSAADCSAYQALQDTFGQFSAQVRSDAVYTS
ncbi:NAD-dependent epimerase/dehydratase family protein [Candidatus Dependentiae bacterium]|nr:NAD-dependent epimerase/dehydratase family protein [Candidatus Dependentiae bacterium]MCC7414709.1 NAD-dependent epimerase/dehydratase family protein [Campylobacterota bacterium]